MRVPDSYHDNQRVGSFSELSAEGLDYLVDVYGDYLQGQGIMQRARVAGNRVLDHLLFEYGYRDGIYDEYLQPKVEDEICDAA